MSEATLFIAVVALGLSVGNLIRTEWALSKIGRLLSSVDKMLREVLRNGG